MSDHAAALPAVFPPNLSLDAFLDWLPLPIALFRGGATLHLNRALRETLQGAPAADTLHAECLRFADGLHGRASHDRAADAASGDAMRREVEIDSARYALHGDCLAPRPADGEALVLVRLERLPAAPLGDECLRERFGLGRKEVRVARLLADGRTNDEIAAELFISPHTARHHTENVLRKLGLTSRRAVADRLRGAGEKMGSASY
jgi:DNA-binding CsgD family transcriptional regulator